MTTRYRVVRCDEKPALGSFEDGIPVLRDHTWDVVEVIEAKTTRGEPVEIKFTVAGNFDTRREARAFVKVLREERI